MKHGVKQIFNPQVVTQCSLCCILSWWRRQKETFAALLALCEGNSSVTGEFPLQRPVTRIFDILFDLRLNKRLSKQSWGWWFETLSRPLWLHSNVMFSYQSIYSTLHQVHHKIYRQLILRRCWCHQAKLFRWDTSTIDITPQCWHDSGIVVEILPPVRQEFAYSTQSVSWVLMSWRRKDQGHQHPWYWLCLHRNNSVPHKGKFSHG